MANKTYTYDPGRVNVIIGSVIVTDFETVSVELQEDGWNHSVGSSGEHTRTKNRNRLANMMIEIPQASSVNLLLSGLAASDTLIPGVIQDKSGASIHTMPKGTIARVADSSYGKNESGTRSWTLTGVIVQNIVGGNR
jgi:hypothetical protein